MWTEHKTVNVGRVRLWHPSLRSLYFTLAFVLIFGMSAPGNPQPLPCPLQHTVLPPPPHFLKPVPSPKTHSQVLLRVRVLTSLGWEAVCWESEPLSSSSPEQGSPAAELQALCAQGGGVLWVCRVSRPRVRRRRSAPMRGDRSRLLDEAS